MIVNLQRKKVVMRLSKNKKINLRAPGRPFDNRGTTIVEIIIAFTMVGIVMTAFTGVIMLSYNFLAKSEQMVEAQEVFSEQFYTGQKFAYHHLSLWMHYTDLLLSDRKKMFVHQ